MISRMSIIQGVQILLIGIVAFAPSAFSQSPAAPADRCQGIATPVECYEAELRALGKVRGQLEHDAAAAKADVATRDAEIARLRTLLSGASQTNPAYQFLVGTWCDEAIPGSPHVQQSVLSVSGRDVLISEGQQGITAAHLLTAPQNEWEFAAMFRANPAAPSVKVVTHGKKIDDGHLQYTVTQTIIGPNPSPGPFPPPQPYSGTLVRCN